MKPRYRQINAKYREPHTKSKHQFPPWYSAQPPHFPSAQQWIVTVDVCLKKGIHVIHLFLAM